MKLKSDRGLIRYIWLIMYGCLKIGCDPEMRFYLFYAHGTVSLDLVRSIRSTQMVGTSPGSV